MIQLQRLNMDNSWWLNINGARVLIDPWLVGAEIDFFSWFNKQWHKTKPVALEEVPEYDFVLITQKYPDHFHKETLSLLQPEKLVVTKSVQKATQKLLPNSDVRNFQEGVRHAFGTELNIHFLSTSRKLDPIYDALILECGGNAVFVATHGFAISKKQQAVVDQFAPFDLLITPFDLYELPAALGGKVSPGVDSVKALASKTAARKIVATHDEDKHAEGLVSKLAKITKAPPAEILSSKDFFGSNYLEMADYSSVKI